MRAIREQDRAATEEGTAARKPWSRPVFRSYSIEESTQTLVAGAVGDGVPGFFAPS